MADRLHKIAVSSCLLGNPVRYDAQHKRHDLIITMLDKYFETIAVCPEMQAGMGTPRPPVKLVQLEDDIHVLGADDNNFDVTYRLLEAAEVFIQQHPDLHGAILTTRSPSCGLDSTPIFDNHGQETGLSSGVLARRMVMAFPGMPIREDIWFKSEKDIEEFVDQVKSYSLTASD